MGSAAIFSLSKAGLTVVGSDDRKLPLGVHSRHLINHYINAPYEDHKFFKDILSIIKKEKPDVLLPIAGTRQISLHKEEISNYTNVLVPDYNSFCTAYNKKKTYEICKDAGVTMPKRYTDEEANHILTNGEKAKLVIKPDYDIGGARGLSFVNTIEALDKARIHLQNISNNYVIEEFIPGGIQTRTVQIVFNKKHDIIASFILKKIHQWPITGGSTAYAVSTNERELLEFVKPFFKKCQWEGPVGIQLIVDERNGKPNLIEINPRFTGSLPFTIQCGVNLPLIVCLSAQNRFDHKTLPAYDSGIFYINLSYYLRAILKEFSLSEKKISFLFQVFRELKRQKVGALLDRTEFPIFLTKTLMKLVDKIKLIFQSEYNVKCTFF